MGAHITITDAMVMVTIAVIFGVYLARALRRSYGGHVIVSSLRAAALMVSLGFVLTGYRMLLFFVTFFTT